MDFETLRAANTKRLPQFKNRHGQPAHSTTDGHDWSPAQWFCAMLGELGETAEVMLEMRARTISAAEYGEKIFREIPDIQIYLDLFAKRCLDITPSTFQIGSQPSVSWALVALVGKLGLFANARKKLDRGDFTLAEYQPWADALQLTIYTTLEYLFNTTDKPGPFIDDKVINVGSGIDLGAATVQKFNEVSERVGSNVFISNSGVIER